MRKIFLSFVIPALLAVPAAARAGDLKFSMHRGLVTLIAEDVPLSAILAEWGRVGETKIVNGEQIFTRVTLHIENTPEKKALDIVLRSAAGYMAAERATPVASASASAFDSIMILPTSRAPAGSPVVAAPPAFAPPPPITPMPDVDDDDPVGGIPGVDPTQQPPSVPGQPGQPGQPQPGQPNPQLTAPRPGMLPQPAPQQPVPFGSPVPGGPGGVQNPSVPGGSPGVPNPTLPGGRGGGSGVPNPNLPGGGGGGQ